MHCPCGLFLFQAKGETARLAVLTFVLGATLGSLFGGQLFDAAAGPKAATLPALRVDAATTAPPPVPQPNATEAPQSTPTSPPPPPLRVSPPAVAMLGAACNGTAGVAAAALAGAAAVLHVADGAPPNYAAAAAQWRQRVAAYRAGAADPGGADAGAEWWGAGIQPGPRVEVAPSADATLARWRDWWLTFAGDNDNFRLFRHEWGGGPGLMPANGRRVRDRRWEFYCQLALLHTKLCRPAEGFDECAARLGWAAVAATLSPRCTRSAFFQGLLRVNNVSGAAVADAAMLPSAGVIPESRWMNSTPGKPLRALPERSEVTDDWPPHMAMPVPEMEAEGGTPCHIHPLPYAVPEENVVDRVERDKIFDFSPLIPGHFPHEGKLHSVYLTSREDEAVAMETHSRSFFALTHRRGGWPCQRHLEHLAAGTVPYFIDLHSRPAGLGLGLPHELLLRAHELPGLARMKDEQYYVVRDGSNDYKKNVRQIARNGFIDREFFNEALYFDVADALLNFTRQRLTTKALAGYFLRAMNLTHGRTPRRVFFSGRFVTFESSALVHGLTSLGIEVTAAESTGLILDFPKYPSRPKTQAEYWAKHAPAQARYFTRGLGWGFGSRADPRLLKLCKTVSKYSEYSEAEHCMTTAARENGTYFDLFIYSHYDRYPNPDTWWRTTDASGPQFPLLREALATVGPNRVAFVDGSDESGSWLLTEASLGPCVAGRRFALISKKSATVLPAKHFWELRTQLSRQMGNAQPAPPSGLRM